LIRSRKTRPRSVRLQPDGRSGLTFADVRRFGLTLPNAEDTTAWGSPMLKVNGRIFAGIPINKDAEPGSVMFIVDFAARDAMIEEQPDIYYTAPHYESYACVLVRLSRVNRDMLEDLLRMSHRHVSSKPPQRRRITKARKGTKATSRSRSKRA